MKKVFFAHDRQESPDERRSYLELTGYQVTLFEHSQELVEACRGTLPDLVLLDVLIPGKNGFETAREIRAILGPGVPVILCSRIYKADVFREEAKAAGCNGYLSMPVQLGEFLACVQSVSQAVSAPGEGAEKAA